MITRFLKRLVLYTSCALALIYAAYLAAPILAGSTTTPWQTSSAPAIKEPGKQTSSAPAIKEPGNNSYVALAQADAIAAGISPIYFVRQINQESGFNPNALSPDGAQGIAQFMPATAAGLGINPWDPVQALQGAANLMARYRRNYGGDYAKALAAYNGGSGRLEQSMQQCGPDWFSCEPATTRHYIDVILGS